jgi:hypothetical protein
MATIVLSAAGMALGGSIGGSVLGLSGSVIGRAAGAALGRAIDGRILGAGSDPVATGRVDRFRLTGASEGAGIAQVHGRIRIAGQVIWAGPFVESVTTTGGGKGTSQPATTTFTYSVSLAIALCEGEITRVGRVWADGVEIARDDLSLRVYLGSEEQLPDPRIEAIEGTGIVPAFRGIAYVVIEDLALARFGNRVPQFSFEVFRPAPQKAPAEAEDIARLIKGVALIPGTGEYSLAVPPVHLSPGYGEEYPANINSASGKSDFLTSLEALTEELPNCGSVSLVVSWFGDDLRCGACRIRPKVEQAEVDGVEMPWQVSGLARGQAMLVPRVDGKPVYGGTPSDQAVVQAIREMRRQGLHVTFYPFILMEQLAGNTLPDPWTGEEGQPPFPWRGRITLSKAPGLPGSPDGSAQAVSQVASFFGGATPSNFVEGADSVGFTGSAQDWGVRRFILHYAHLARVAGGVDAFCIGSEMRGLTQIRGPAGFPAVEQLRTLATEVKAILGPNCKISYAADWSEYHGYQPPGTGDKLFHLDPLWADPAIDFVAIDNYMPLSDWRDGTDHVDAPAGSIYDLAYLTGNVAGGEGFDWYYHSEDARAAQIRTPISDFWGEDWVWRYKDIRGWWGNEHRNRINGTRATTPTAWVPEMKPIWFTEIGCAAIDKGTNEPNKFLDPKSSESAPPRYSNGLRDDFMQMQYLRAIHRHFALNANNPVSREYNGRMVDTARTHVWAWDARPWPHFPARGDLWSDGDNYDRGHWINGRSTSRALASVVEEICRDCGIPEVDTSRLWGIVRGYAVDGTDTGRQKLQTLMLANAFDAAEREGRLAFVTRTGQPVADVDPSVVAIDPEAEASVTVARAAEAEVTGRVRVSFVDSDSDYAMAAAEAVMPDEATRTTAETELPLALLRAEGRQVAERWLAESRLARDRVRFALPLSSLMIGAGDVIRLNAQEGPALYRIDRIEEAGLRAVEAVRVEPEVYLPHETAEDRIEPEQVSPPVPVEATFLDLPLITGDEVPHAPHVAFVARKWPGKVALYASDAAEGFRLDGIYPVPSVVGETLGNLSAATAGLWDQGPALRVRLVRGTLASASTARVLGGANLAAIGDGLSDLWELFQFVEAELVAPRTYDIRIRLRGQNGTDGVMPAEWPTGSRFVLLDGLPKQIGLASSQRGLSLTWRWGAAARPIGDPSYRSREVAFQGIGLRPYSVCHLRASAVADGATDVTWIRRTRLDGDLWGSEDVPLGETGENYLIQVLSGGALRREVRTTASTWRYAAGQKVADAADQGFLVRVAQLSDRFGPGPFRELWVGPG